MSEKRYNGFSEEDLRMVALKKVNFRMSVKIHLGVFIFGSVLFLVINGFTSTYLWFLYPILGWFVGFVEHLTAYLVYARGVYPMAKRGVIFHVVTYITVILLLFVINFITNIIFFWVVFPAIFWGIAIGIHVVVYLVYYRGATVDLGVLKSKKERAVDKELEKMQRKYKK
jgi:hypothetical protein